MQVVDKIRVQMDAFLDDGDHEGTVAVMRALAAAVPHTTPSLRDYILFALFWHTYYFGSCMTGFSCSIFLLFLSI